jgi:hypothetical protein
MFVRCYEFFFFSFIFHTRPTSTIPSMYSLVLLRRQHISRYCVAVFFWALIYHLVVFMSLDLLLFFNAFVYLDLFLWFNKGLVLHTPNAYMWLVRLQSGDVVALLHSMIAGDIIPFIFCFSWLFLRTVQIACFMSNGWSRCL